MRRTCLDSFVFGVGLLGPETGHQDLQIGVHDDDVGYDLCEGNHEKAVNVVDGYIGADQGQQTGLVAVGVRQHRPTAR